MFSVQYYYYYRYMRKRINEMHPQLPDAVMDKLLTYDAEELDTLLKYPSAAQGQVEQTTPPPHILTSRQTRRMIMFLYCVSVRGFHPVSRQSS